MESSPAPDVPSKNHTHTQRKRIVYNQSGSVFINTKKKLYLSIDTLLSKKK
jgi:hypothetical protein